MRAIGSAALDFAARRGAPTLRRGSVLGITRRAVERPNGTLRLENKPRGEGDRPGDPPGARSAPRSAPSRNASGSWSDVPSRHSILGHAQREPIERWATTADSRGCRSIPHASQPQEGARGALRRGSGEPSERQVPGSDDPDGARLTRGIRGGEEAWVMRDHQRLASRPRLLGRTCAFTVGARAKRTRTRWELVRTGPSDHSRQHKSTTASM